MSSHGFFRPPPARNEPVHDFAPGSPERVSLQRRLEQMRGERIEIPLVIGGKDVASGTTRPAVMPMPPPSTRPLTRGTFGLMNFSSTRTC